MPLSWYLVRNHAKGRMRSAEEIGSELDVKVREFELKSGVIVDELLREELGIGQWLAHAEAPANYSHPVARAESHGPLTLLCLAVPSSLYNGISDFTNVLILAHPDALLTIIRDPEGTYSADFGGRLLTDYRRHEKNEREFTAGEVAFRATRSCVLSLEVSLTTLRATVGNHFKKLRAIELREQRVGQDLDGLEADFGKTYAELRGMVRTPGQILVICDTIEQWSISGEQGNLFETSTARQVMYLKARVDQVEAMLNTFILDIERAIKRCDDVSKRELLDAQRKNTYWTSALLLPNLIFAFFGQSFLGDAKEGERFWWISGAILVLYGAGSTFFLVKRSRQGR